MFVCVHVHVCLSIIQHLIKRINHTIIISVQCIIIILLFSAANIPPNGSHACNYFSLFPQFDWYDLKSLGSPTHPIKVSLLDSDRVTVMSRLFEDVRLSYSWYNINRLIKYIRVDTVRKDKGTVH